MPNPGQEVGTTGIKPSFQVSKIIIDKLKSGDEYQFYQELKMHNVEPRDIYEQNTALRARMGYPSGAASLASSRLGGVTNIGDIF